MAGEEVCSCYQIVEREIPLIQWENPHLCHYCTHYCTPTFVTTVPPPLSLLYPHLCHHCTPTFVTTVPPPLSPLYPQLCHHCTPTFVTTVPPPLSLLYPHLCLWSHLYTMKLHHLLKTVAHPNAQHCGLFPRRKGLLHLQELYLQL